MTMPLATNRRKTQRQPVTLAEPPGLAASTGYLLARVGADSRRRWARTLSDLHVTPHHYSLLLVLDQHGPMSQRRLSEYIGIDPRNLVPLIDQLQDRGLLRREPDGADRRRYAVTLAPRGGDTLATLRKTAEKVERDMLAPLTSGEQQVLHRLLATLFNASGGTGST